MKRIVKIVTIVGILTVSLMLGGCSLGQKENMDTHSYVTGNRFKILYTETIHDGTADKIVLTTLVDKTTGVMYVQTEKCKDEYGIGLAVLVDKDGNPLLYDEEL